MTRSVHDQARWWADQLAGLEKRIRGVESKPGLAYSSIEDGAVKEYNRDGQLVSVIGKQWDGTHGAYPVTGPVPPRPTAPVLTGGLGLTIGWDGTFATDAGEQDITITAPMDWSRVELHVSKVSGFAADTADTLVDSIESPRGGSRPALVEPGTWYAVLVSRSLTGKRSVQSAESSAVVTPPVGSDIDLEKLEEERKAAEAELQRQINENRVKQGELAGTITELQETTLPALDLALGDTQSRLDAIPRTVEQAQAAADDAKRVADTAVTNAGTAKAAADNAAQAARDAAGLAATKGKTLIQSTAPAAEDRNAMTLWIDTTNNGNVPKKWTTGTTWVTVQDKTAVDAAKQAAQAVTDAAAAKKAADAAQAAADAAAVRIDPLESAMTLMKNTTIPALQTSIDGKTTIFRKTAAPAQGDTTGAVGDRWEYWSTLNAGGKLRATYRKQSTGWLQEVLDPTYLPLVDIGSGTIGNLSGGRIDTFSLRANQVLIGAGSNLFPDPDLLDTGAGGWTTGVTLEGLGTGRYGRGSVLVPASTAQSGSYYGLNDAGRRIPVTPGDSLRVVSHVRASVAAPANTLRMYVRAADGAGNLIWPTPSAINNAAAVPATTWTKLEGIVKVPDNAVSMTIGFFTQPEMTGSARFSDPSVAHAADGSLVVENSITAREVNGESVAGAVGSFIELGVEQLVVTKGGKFNDLVSKQIAADSGKYLSLSTDQLIAGTANIDTGVANKFYAGIFASNKIYGTQIVLGQTSNLLPDPTFTDAKMLELRNAASTCTVGKRGADIELNNTGTGNTYFRPLGVQQTPAGVTGGGWIPVQPGDVWEWGLSVVGIKEAGGWIKFVGRTKDGSAYANPTAQVNLPAGSGTYSVTATIPADCYWLMPEMLHRPGVSLVTSGSMYMRQKITPALIVAGLIDGQRVVGASIESNAAANRGVKLTDAGLFAFNSSGVETVRLDGANSILTGATIRTAASGARWQMSAAGLEAWNAKGERYLLGNADGLEMIGSLSSKGQTADGSPINVRLTTVTRNLMGQTTVPNPALVFDLGGAVLGSAPGIYSADGKSLTFVGGENIWGQGQMYLAPAEISGYADTIKFGSIGMVAPTVDMTLHAKTLNLGSQGNSIVKINGRTYDYTASARVSLSNGFLHHTGSGWDGLKVTVSGDVVEITGAYERSTAWAGGTVIATLPANLRPSASKQGQGMSINAVGQIMADAGQGPKSGFIVYIRA